MIGKMLPFGLALLAAGAVSIAPAAAQDTCKSRGQLDDRYCDENGDLVADVPKDASRLRDPSTLVFAYTPVEDPAVYENVFKPFTDYLGKCVSKRVVYFPVQSNSAEIEAMRSGRLHVAGFSTGPTGFAVNMAGAIPFATKGTGDEVQGYQLFFLVKKDSAFKTIADLKGKKVAHTSPSSNSGHLAPLVLFPKEGLKPDGDYKPVFSGGHDKTVLGVRAGDYDGGPVASDVYSRMVVRNTVKDDDFRIIYKSEVFPTSSFAYAHDLKPELAEKMKKCFYDFIFTPEMTKEFNGNNRFVPITYQKHWEVVRRVAEGSGTPYNRAAYEREAKREAEAAAKKAAAKNSPEQKK